MFEEHEVDLPKNIFDQKNKNLTTAVCVCMSMGCRDQSERYLVC